MIEDISFFGLLRSARNDGLDVIARSLRRSNPGIFILDEYNKTIGKQ
jgi:hypothetical protein